MSTLQLLDEWNQQGTLCISVVTRAEIFAGMHPREKSRTESLLQSLVTLDVDIPVADQAGRWIYTYARKGVQLSFPDALIAATAWRHDLVLATTNTKHFPMPEVQLAHPTL